MREKENWIEKGGKSESEPERITRERNVALNFSFEVF